MVCDVCQTQIDNLYMKQRNGRLAKQKQMFIKGKYYFLLKCCFYRVLMFFNAKYKSKNIFIFVVLSIYFSLEKLKLKGVRFVCYVAFRKHCFCLIKLENLNAVEMYIILAHKFLNRFKNKHSRVFQII